MAEIRGNGDGRTCRVLRRCLRRAANRCVRARSLALFVLSFATFGTAACFGLPHSACAVLPGGRDVYGWAVTREIRENRGGNFEIRARCRQVYG